MTNDRLQKWQAIATIVSAIAVPLVIAIVGWRIQMTVSSDSVRKDYVQMAIGILSKPKTAEDEPLRQWAIAVLDKNSPVPFTKGVKSSLAAGVYQPQLFRHIAATGMMTTPPQPWVSLPADVTPATLQKNYIENMRRAESNYLSLQYLQQAVLVGVDTEKLQRPMTDWGPPPKGDGPEHERNDKP